MLKQQLRLRSTWMAAAFVLVSGGCTSATPTTVTDVWRDPTYSAGPMKTMVVFGGRLTETNRRTVEDGFVSALSARGVRATPSYALFPSQLPSRDDARAAIAQIGADGVLVSTMRGTSERQSIEGGFWDGYYGSGWGGSYDPVNVSTDQFVKFETTIWNPQDAGRVVWSAVTQTENPASGRDFASSLVQTVTSALTHAGFLAAPHAPQRASYAAP